MNTQSTPQRQFPRIAPVLITVGTACLFALALRPAFVDGSDNLPSTPYQRDTPQAAIDYFWDVYHGNRYQDIPAVQQQLETAIQKDALNPMLNALVGATHFWHLGEIARDPHPNLTVVTQDMPLAVASFQKALDLDYGPHPIQYINDDHLPGYLGITTVHLGQLSNNPELVAQGDKLLDYAMYQFPEFNNFNRWAAHNADTKDSATYQQALDSLCAALDACAGTTVDRSNPDLAPYLNLVTAKGRKRVCWWDGLMAPYSYEGIMLNLGSGLVKAGQIDAAKIVFANARYASNYANWPYRQQFEAITGSDLYARAALYADSNPFNDPPLAIPNRSCSYCHAIVPESVAIGESGQLIHPPVH
jgi:hypothetical protein